LDRFLTWSWFCGGFGRRNGFSQDAAKVKAEKGRWMHQKASEHPPCQRKTEGGLENGLAVEKEENHEKGPRCSWARNQMGNPE
jgi:hypothetical protein